MKNLKEGEKERFLAEKYLHKKNHKLDLEGCKILEEPRKAADNLSDSLTTLEE